MRGLPLNRYALNINGTLQQPYRVPYSRECTPNCSTRILHHNRPFPPQYDLAESNTNCAC